MSQLAFEFPHWVVHCRRASYDVYIGRPGPWGNPFEMESEADRDRVCDLHEELVLSQPELTARIKQELRGKILGCWCAPKRCHGDTLARIANE